MNHDFEALLREAESLFRQERFLEAKEKYGQIIERHPDHLESLLRLSEIAWILEDWQNLSVFAKKAIEYAPDNATAYIFLGVAYEAGQDVDASISCYKAALHYRIDDPAAWDLLRKIYLKNNLLDDFREFSDAACKQYPTKLHPNYNQALFLLNDERYEDAVTLLEEIIHRWPDFAETYMLLPNAYVQLVRRYYDEKAFNQVVDCCKKALIRFDEHPALINPINELKKQMLQALSEQNQLGQAEILLPELFSGTQGFTELEELLMSLYRKMGGYWPQSTARGFLTLLEGAVSSNSPLQYAYYREVLNYSDDQIPGKSLPFIYNHARNLNDWKTADRFWPAFERYVIEESNAGHPVIYGNLLNLLSEPKASLSLLKGMHICYGTFFVNDQPDTWRPDWENAFTITDRVRIGIVVAVASLHVNIGKFLNGWISHYDQSRFELFCYAYARGATEQQKEATSWYREKVDHFR